MTHYLLPIFFIIFLPISSFCDNEKIEIKELAKDPTWLKLLYFDKEKSSVISDEFFLSPNGKTNPESELKATINAYTDESLTNTDEQARCKFPARYLWLSKHINLPNYQVIDSSCKKLSKWSPYNETNSISLLFVSGYLGNPASTFGHSFLKLNTDVKTTRSNLMDSSISYGALVPDNENALLYIFKGISGKYEAGFSDKYYYTQDLVYSNTEFRDIWEYELNLSKEQQKLLLLHIWEITGKKFQYFFTNKNCAFQVSKMLELVIDEPIIKSANYWYAPVETCHIFREINTKKELENKKPLLNKITYIPSQQRVIYAHYNALSKKAKSITSEMIENHQKNIPLKYDKLSEDEKINIIDFVLAYYKYLLVKNRDDNQTIIQKDKILHERLKLPIRAINKLTIKERISPDFDNKPMFLSSSLSYTDNQKYYPTIRFSPFAIESVGQNSLNADELVVLDTTLGINGKQDKLFIDSFDLIKIRKFKTLQMPFDQESPWSWQIKIGAKHIDNQKSKYDFFTDGGIGTAKKLNDKIMFFAMANISAHSSYPHIKFTPNVGIHLNLNKFKTLMTTGFETDTNRKKLQPLYHVESAYKVFENLSISTIYTKNRTKKLSAGLQWFF